MQVSATFKIAPILLLCFALAGCSSQKSVICFVPVEPYEPNSGAELLEELNSQLPFKIPPQNFMCRYSAGSGNLVGWIITQTIEQKDIAKEKLGQSASLGILQVESLSQEFEAIFKEQWEQSQNVKPPAK